MPGCCAACCSHAALLVARYACVAPMMRRDEAVYAAPSTERSFSDKYLQNEVTKAATLRHPLVCEGNNEKVASSREVCRFRATQCNDVIAA